LSSLIERAGATVRRGRREARSLDQVLPDRGDEGRSRDMQATWQAFCLERHDAVRATFDRGRSPPEIAYAIGELLHTYFRTRGVTLTSHELRRLVAEILETQKLEMRPAPPPREEARAEPVIPDPPLPDPPAPAPPAVAAPPTAVAADEPPVPEAPATQKREEESPAPLVSFTDPPRRATTWTGAEAVEPPVVPEAAFEAPPSPLVNLLSREEASFDRLLAQTLAMARPRLGDTPGKVSRAEALRAIDAAVDEVVRADGRPLDPEMRERLVLTALSETCGLGLIDRLWADRSVQAVIVNGPDAVYLERASGMERSAEKFRDRAHLLELATRLAGSPANGVAEVRLRDGATATVVFPPAAPEGPVLAIRRGEPGLATFERLIASDILDRSVASLLRIAARARLNVLVVGPSGSGKSALLAAMAQDVGTDARIVTLSPNRDFRWATPNKVELVASSETPYAALLAAAVQLRPGNLFVDQLQRQDVGPVVDHLSAGTRGAAIACDPSTVSPALMRSVDMVVRLGRARDGLWRPVAFDDAAGVSIFVYEDGRFQRRGSEPAFAELVRAAGQSEALANLLQ
jgi:pilus assembly protein CpaF